MKLNNLVKSIEYSELLEIEGFKILFDNYLEYNNFSPIPLKDNLYQLFNLSALNRVNALDEEEYMYLGIRKTKDELLFHVFVGVDIYLNSAFNVIEISANEISEKNRIRFINTPKELLKRYIQIVKDSCIFATCNFG